ncbi:ribose-phosphate diphosphokinase [Paenibacillus agricola]|uniref:ribose-phosphate diphosphokinase n=1 Tax=Paenibacillus agricola TaxID=2716264 RepID=A0ABX0JCA8_9BACL|nr:ribose-phosphate pyrophosphokinase [Paenibacillus agricola]NHN32869.1 ribose-phosphate pyrophosphokinase [Paenibacillus agricola]
MIPNFRVFAGSSHPKLAESICNHLDHPLGRVKRSRFKNGEIYVHYEDGLRNCDVYLIQTFSYPVNEHFVELLIMIDAAKRASARSVNVVVPYLGYSRQERKSAPREPISAKMVADVITTLGVNRVITLDLHSPAIQGFFNIPVDHLTALDLLSEYIKSKQIHNPVIVSPDAGRAETAEKLASHLDCPFSIMVKKRTAHNEASITHIIGEVNDRTPIIIEDIIDSGSTIIKVVEALIDRGSKDAYICATHPIFSESAIERLKHPNIKEIVVTDSIPLIQACPDYLKVISVASLLAQSIRINMLGGSISSLFEIKSL